MNALEGCARIACTQQDGSPPPPRGLRDLTHLFDSLMHMFYRVFAAQEVKLRVHCPHAIAPGICLWLLKPS